MGHLDCRLAENNAKLRLTNLVCMLEYHQIQMLEIFCLGHKLQVFVQLLELHLHIEYDHF